jgi:hypothetical protein
MARKRLSQEEEIRETEYQVLFEVTHDTQARVGCKEGDKFWYGYKKHVRSVIYTVWFD